MVLSFEVEVLIPALSGMPTAVVITDLKGVVLWVNASFEALSGYSAGELSGRKVETIRPAFDEVRRALENGQPWKQEALWCLRNGDIRRVGEAISGVPDSQGKVSHYLCIVTDGGVIFSQVISLMAEGVAFLNAEGGLEVWNEAMERITGLTGDQLRGRSSLDPRWRAIREDGSPFPGDQHPSLVALRTGQPQVDVIVGIHKPDGTLVWVSNSAWPLSTTTRNPYSVITTARDITAEKRLKDSLQQSELEFSRLFLLSPMVMTLTYEDGHGVHRYVNVNRAFEELTEFKGAEVIGRSPEEIGLWADLADRDAAIAEFRASGRIRAFEGHFRTKTGKILIGLLSIDGIEIGGKRMAISSTVDITEKKLAEETLRKANEAVAAAERRYRLLFNNVSDAVFVFTLEPDGVSSRFLDVNDKACEMLGYGRDELIQMQIGDLETPESQLCGQESASKLLREGSVQKEAVMLAKNGTRIPVEINTQVLDLDGSLLMISSVRNLTKRREAERKYQAIFDGAIEGIFRTTLQGIALEANPAHARMLGYASPQEYLEAAQSGCAKNFVDPDMLSKIGKALREHNVVIGWEFQTLRKDGSTIWVSFHCRRVLAPDGRALYLEGFAVDISEHKRMEEEKARLEVRLRQAEKLEGIGRLAGGVAHEFNNILTVVNGYAGLLLGKLKATDDLYSHAEAIKQSGERAAVLTRQLLAFSRKQTFHPQRIGLNATIGKFLLMLEPLLGETIRISARFEDGLGDIMTDPDQLHYVMMNLVLNARDAMPEGGQIEITASNVLLGREVDVVPGPYVRITFGDTGHGIEESVRAHIFEPFFTTKDVGEGTGLGLATVYGIVRQSDGWIDVESQLGIGTRFHVHFPRIEVAVKPVETTAAGRDEGGRETILLVEDQKAVRAFTRMALEDFGYRVLEAADGVEALAVSASHQGPIHLLLTDVILPGMNGRKLSGQLVSTRPDLKVVFVSGYPGDVIGQQGVLNESVAFLQKPYSPDELADKVRQVLGRA